MNKFEKIISDMSPYLSEPCFVKFEDSVQDTYVGINMPKDFILLPRLRKTPVPVIVRLKPVVRIRAVSEMGLPYIPLDTNRITKSTELHLLLVSSEIVMVRGKNMLKLLSYYVNRKETLFLSLDEGEINSVPTEINTPQQQVRYKT